MSKIISRTEPLTIALLALLGFVACIYFNITVFDLHFRSEPLNQRSWFAVTFINIMLVLIIMLPWLIKWLRQLPSRKFLEFVELDQTPKKVTFSSFSDFLGGQALASTVTTIMMFVGVNGFDFLGGVATAILMFLLLLVAIIIAVNALIQFIILFHRLHALLYAFISLSSALIMFSFFNIGVKMAVS